MIIGPIFEDKNVKIGLNADCCSPDICWDFEIVTDESEVSFRLTHKKALELSKVIEEALKDIDN